ncbi:MAG: tetratricopeptide repeat protein [Planctomycetota bacterium]
MHVTESPAPTPLPARVRLLLAGLVLLVLGLYARTATHKFVAYDDPVYVSANPVVAEGLTLDGLRWSFGFHAGNWHPLTWLAHMLDVELFELEPGPHHLVNVALHALNAALVLLLAARLGAGAWAALLAAALFALHPLRVESVAWASERKDVLSGALYLATLLAWLRHVRVPSRGRYALALALFALGLMAKSMLVTLPVVLVLLDLSVLGRPLSRARWLEKAPFFALALATGAATLWIQQQEGAVGSMAALPAVERVANALRSCGVYVVQSLWPVNLACLVPHPSAVTPPAELARVLFVPAAAVLVLLLAALALAWRARRSRPELLLGLGWYLAVAAPVIGFVQVGVQAHADRYTYLPTIGLAFAAAVTLQRAVRAAPALRAPLLAGGVLVLAALSVLTTRQVATWRDSKTLFTHALAVTEKNWVAATYLGEVERMAGELDAAQAHLEFALEVQKGHVPALFELARVHLERGELGDARRLLKRTLRNDPSHALAQRMLARVERELGESGAEED